MKRIMLLGVVMILPLTSYSMETKPKKDGYNADFGKHAGEPGAQELRQAFDTNTPILANGMQNFGSQAAQIVMQSLPQNLILATSIAIGTAVAVTVTDAAIKHAEKSYSGELEFERMENKRKTLESYRKYVRDFSVMPEEKKRDLIAFKEFQATFNDFQECFTKNAHGWLYRDRLYCDSDGNPVDCQLELYAFLAVNRDPEAAKSEIISKFYEKR